MTAAVPVIDVRDLKKHFPIGNDPIAQILGRKQKSVRAVDGVSLKVVHGQTLGLVGESGSGKTTLGKTIVRLYKPTAGNILFRGTDIASLEGKELKGFRSEAQMVFQDPYESMNPRFTAGETLVEPLLIHRVGTPDQRWEMAIQMLERVGLKPAEEFMDRFPHEMSGGQRQRVCIARALIVKPKVLVADEPVSMLDVSIRADILNLLRGLIDEMGLASLYISHDLSLIRYVCDTVAILYLGRVVEMGPTEDIIQNPLHPYSQALLAAVPVPDPRFRHDEDPLEGEPPNPVDLPPGCRFRPRCQQATPRCLEQEPEPSFDGERYVECHLHS